MSVHQWPWLPVLLLAAGLIFASAGRAAETDIPSAEATTGQGTAAEKKRDASGIDAPPSTPDRPAAKPPPHQKPSSRSRAPYRPSEEIHVDKAVDFPADI